VGVGKESQTKRDLKFSILEDVEKKPPCQNLF